MEGLSDGVIPAEKETFELVSRETARLTRLVNGLQELSKVEAGSVSLKYDLIRIVELVENLTRQYQPLFEEKKLELRVELSKVTAATPVVLGDADRLTQVFTNLLSNALQFSPENSTVILAGKQEGKKIHFSVKDMGIGLTKDDLGKVFERFYRVDRSRNREFGNGSGIGLSIAKALVDQHKGNIWAESPGVGLGSTFHILLPLV
jgi:signal transduction histidine kinase